MTVSLPWYFDQRTIQVKNKSCTTPQLSGSRPPGFERAPLIGVLEGTGIGSEVIGSALQVLASVDQVTGVDFEVRRGTLIGEDALTHFGQWLPEEVVDFCSEIFRLVAPFQRTGRWTLRL